MALFNVRVYGLLFDRYNRLLVSDEFIRGNFYTKLPGGGLEIGEGTRDCLKREFMEETGLEVTVGEHLYTTDFFQISAFNNKDQIISIYYSVTASDPIDIKTQTQPFQFTPDQIADPDGESEVFRWIEWDSLSENDMSLPIDKVVIGLIKKNQSLKKGKHHNSL
ncbi:MAG: NUDIX domain-containing protein [Bacteroidota bacterium]|nr:NUDIX domain-containing protein [Bacteroidota bacterium]